MYRYSSLIVCILLTGNVIGNDGRFSALSSLIFGQYCLSPIFSFFDAGQIDMKDENVDAHELLCFSNGDCD